MNTIKVEFRVTRVYSYKDEVTDQTVKERVSYKRKYGGGEITLSEAEFLFRKVRRIRLNEVAYIVSDLNMDLDSETLLVLFQEHNETLMNMPRREFNPEGWEETKRVEVSRSAAPRAKKSSARKRFDDEFDDEDDL